MTSSPCVGIILLNTNQDQFTRDCINSLKEGTNQHYKIVVVDNQSRHTLGNLMQSDNQICIIESDTNLGFCGGNNVGIKHFLLSKTDYILILNNDTLSHPDFLAALVSTGEAWERKAVIAPKIFYDHDRTLLWYAGGYLNYFQGLGKHYGFREHDCGLYDKARRVEYVTGCCMLVPSDVYRTYGMMKETLFIYMDDTEYSIRLKKCGVPIIYEPRAILYHRVSGGLAMADYTPFYLYHITRNRIYITDSLAYRIYLFFINMLYSVLRLCFYILKKRNRRKRFQILAILRGLRDGLQPGKYSYFQYKWE